MLIMLLSRPQLQSIAPHLFVAVLAMLLVNFTFSTFAELCQRSRAATNCREVWRRRRLWSLLCYAKVMNGIRGLQQVVVFLKVVEGWKVVVRWTAGKVLIGIWMMR